MVAGVWVGGGELHASTVGKLKANQLQMWGLKEWPANDHCARKYIKEDTKEFCLPQRSRPPKNTRVFAMCWSPRPSFHL